MRLSLGRERGLGGHVVQNASESDRIRPDPAKTVKPRRFLDHSRAEPVENSETQTHFGPLPPRFAVEPAGAGAPKAQRAGVRPHWGRQRGVPSRIGVGKRALGQANCLPQWVVSCPQCVSLESGGGAGPVLAAIPRGLRAPGSGSRAPWAVFTAIPTRRGTLSQRYLRFHSATTLCKRYNTCKVTVSL